MPPADAAITLLRRRHVLPRCCYAVYALLPLLMPIAHCQDDACYAIYTLLYAATLRIIFAMPYYAMMFTVYVLR